MPSAFLIKSFQSVGAVGAENIAVGLGEGVTFDSATFVGVGEAVGVGSRTFVGAGEGDGIDVGSFLITTPLFQIIFLPLLMHMYLTLETVFVAPTLLHFVPEIVAEKAVGVERINEASSEPIRTIRLKPALTRTEYLG